MDGRTHDTTDARAPGGPSALGASAAPTGPVADQASVITVGTEQAGQRLDNFLMRLAKGVPKSHVYRIVRSGEVRINKARARADQRVQAGDLVRIPPLRIARGTADRSGAGVPILAPALMPPVLFEDEHLLVIDKPAGLAAHGGSGIAFGLIERLRAACPNQPFLELAHRLDRETSGVLLVAKSRRALLGLHAALRDGAIDKRYLTLVLGDWVNDRQHVREPLTKYVTRAGERRVAVDVAGAVAHTVFSLRARFGPFSLLEAQLRTGRTHQIRVHLAHLGFPIAGDDKYGDFELNRALARGSAAGLAGVRLGRMFLHAFATSFLHPVTAEAVALTAPLPPDCEDVLQALRRA
jgi:23S rRNA pseudouridine955/2504/2580 synthase